MGRRLVYPDRVKEGLAIRLERFVTELKVAAISHVVEKKEHDIRPLQGPTEVVGPSAVELDRLIHPPPDNPTNRRVNSFASLLNRGSHLE